MKVQVITLFPNIFETVLATSMMDKAARVGALEYSLINLRDFGLGPHQQVDDTPYGGGDGMLLRVEPLFAAYQKAHKADPGAKVYLMSPAGQKLTQAKVRDIAELGSSMIIICAHYEGYDERIISLIKDIEVISIGDYVLTGGEPAAIVLIDAVTRLLPGVLGGPTSAQKESFSEGDSIEHPHYTRPEVFKGLKVPPVLLSGHHKKIEAWRDENTKR